MLTESERKAILEACRHLPAPRGQDEDFDYIMHLMMTVLDYHLPVTTLSRAGSHFRSGPGRWISTAADLRTFLERYPDDRMGNTAAAEKLWGYRYWNRVEQLRRLLAYFESIGVTDKDKLREWARTSTFESDFQGRVPGLGFAVYKWLVIRLGVDSVKPDLRVHRFLRRIIGRQLTDDEAVSVLGWVASELGRSARDLDFSIWEYEEGKAS